MCPEGFYCSSAADIVEAADTAVVCPVGHYCPEGTTEFGGYPCNLGQYQDNTGKAWCKTCPAGFYCDQSAMTTPILCEAGYYCKNGAYVQFPFNLDLTKGDICPKGHYCPAGSGFPIPCPPGYACPDIGLDDYSATPCTAGYYCNRAAISVTPNGFLTQGGAPCPPGHFCEAQTASPAPCLPGTFMPIAGAVACLACPEFKYCEGYGTIEPETCAEGWYCGTSEFTRRPSA